MATAPAAPTSALIEALRGASAPGLPNPGIRFYDNAQNGMALPSFSRKSFAGYVPPQMAAPAPRPVIIAPTAPVAPVVSGGGGGGTVSNEVSTGPKSRIIKPAVTTESGLANTASTAGTGAVSDTSTTPGGTTPGGTTIDVTSPGITTTNLKTDASHWGANDTTGTFGVLLSDMDDDTLGSVDDVNGADLDSDNFVDPLDTLGSVNDVNGADLQSDRYTFGVLLSDMDDDTLGSVNDVNGSDLQSDQYTFGVLMSDQDPVREEIVDINKLIDEWDMFAFAREAERKLREKFDTPEDMER
jgi:hypothetical protein